jgi:soluble lytic murein transglycosylase-like protein
VEQGRVALIALVAVLLVADAPPRAHEEASASALPEQVVSASDVSRIVGSVSPTLSPHELERIGTAVVRYSSKYGLDPELVTAVLLVESSARPWVRSPKGAIGLMQVMPYMAAPMGMAGNLATIESNVEAGCIILAGNIARLGEEDGISAYFWGSKIRGVAYLGRVQAARDRVRRELHS